MAAGDDGTRHAPRGMVCSVDHLASEAGVAVMRAGGSAADAAIAASAVLAVTTPHACGMGGDLFALVSAGGDRPACLAANGAAGSGADLERLRAEGWTRMPFRGDVRSVPVPGCVDGWVLLHERFGRLPMSDVLADAIRFAEEGFPAPPLLAAAAPDVAGTPLAADLLPGGSPPAPGQLLRRPGVGRALRSVVEDGRSGFYEGDFGEGLLALGRGEFTRDDLRQVQARWVEPLGIPVWGETVWTTPPPSQGYLTLLTSAIAESAGLPPHDEDPMWAHLLVESAKAAGHDRPAVLSEHADGPALVSPEQVAARAALVDPSRTAVLPAGTDHGGTIHLCAADRDGMGVSLIQSNASGFGSGLAVEGLGIMLHNRGLGFSVEPGHPAAYGPGRRPPHTLSPALVTAPDGRLRAVLGTMGGDTQPQTVSQVLARLFPGRATAGAAIGRPRWALTRDGTSGFDTWDDPSSIVVALEPDAPAAWAEALERLGHRVVVGAAAYYGHAHAIAVRDGVLEGASDPRAPGSAAAGW